MSTPSDVSPSTGAANAHTALQHGSVLLSAEEAADEPPCSPHRQRSPPLLTSPSPTTLLTTPNSTVVPTIEITNDDEPTNDKVTKAEDLEAQISPASPQSRHIRFRFPHLSKRSRLRALFTPTRTIGPAPAYGRSIINVITFSPLVILLVFIPINWALHWSHQSDVIIFTTSALAIIPLAALLGFGTEQVAIRTSSAVAGFLNVSLGNLVELIIAGIALQRCELALVQSSLLGGLLSNLLLVLGMSFIVGGLRFPEQSFQPIAAQLHASLLVVGVISLMMPTAFHMLLGSYLADDTVEGPILLKISRVSSIILIIIYIAYLGFQFYTHNHLFLDTRTDSDASSRHATWGGSSASSRSIRSSNSSISFSRSHRWSHAAHTSATAVSEKAPPLFERPVAPPDITDTTHIGTQPLSRMASIDTASVSSIETIHYPKVNVPVALSLLMAVTALLYLTAENLVDSLEAMTAANPTTISKEFLSLIILPILSNAAEHSTAVVVAYKGKFDLVLGVAVGSCIQISLFVIPLLVLVAWGMGKPLSLLFDPMETVCLFFSVILAKFLIEDGKSHWMSGLTLIGIYIIISATFWFYPTHLMGVLGGNMSLFACHGGN